MDPTACDCKVDCESLDVESNHVGEFKILFLILIAVAQWYQEVTHR